MQNPLELVFSHFISASIHSPEALSIDYNTIDLLDSRFQTTVTTIMIFLSTVFLISLLSQTQTKTPRKITTTLFTNTLILIMALSLAYTLIFTTDNIETSRRIFEVEIFTPEECVSIIASAASAASSSASLGLGSSSPKIRGWSQSRHDLYPTVDLNVADDHVWPHFAHLKELLDERLSPAIEAAYGVPRASLRAQDIFIVRYDAIDTIDAIEDGNSNSNSNSNNGQDHLIQHTDGAFISFNVLLNADFSGGGTRFVDRRSGSSVTAHPRKVGNGLLHRAKVLHEGLSISRGSRYVLVGFIELDTSRYDSGASTGLSVYSSYLSLGWLESWSGHLYTAMKMKMKQENRKQENGQQQEEDRGHDLRGSGPERAPSLPRLPPPQRTLCETDVECGGRGGDDGANCPGRRIVLD